MRDPGPPRRNPFFEHGSEGANDDPGMGWRDPEDADATGHADAADHVDAAGHADAADHAAGGFAALVALAESLAEAQPEAAEHLVAAAHEVVLSVKVLVDATEAVLADQRAAMAARREAGATDPVTDLSVVREADGR
jgi:hypothetical protein